VFLGTDPPVYRASTSLVVLPDREASTEPGYYDTLSRGQVVLTFAQILDLRARNAVPAGSDVDVQVAAVPDTSLIDVRATAPTAAEAEDAADRALRASRPYFRELPSPYEIYVVRDAAGSAERSGGVSPALLVLIPVVALVAGLVTQQVLRALGVTTLRSRVVVPLRTRGTTPRRRSHSSPGVASAEGNPVRRPPSSGRTCPPLPAQPVTLLVTPPQPTVHEQTQARRALLVVGATACCVLFAVLVAAAAVGALPWLVPLVFLAVVAAPALVLRPTACLVVAAVVEAANLSGVAAERGVPGVYLLVLALAAAAAGLCLVRGEIRPAWSPVLLFALVLLAAQWLAATSAVDQGLAAAGVLDTLRHLVWLVVLLLLLSRVRTPSAPPRAR
jgi:hypothetical protein